MAKRVLRAPLSFFETTPLGRILNRFTYDVEVLDVELSVSMMGLVVSFSWLVAAVVVMVVVLPWMMLGIVPVTAMYFFIQYYYRMSGPDLQRIDAVSRSPLQASLAEGDYPCVQFFLFDFYHITQCNVLSFVLQESRVLLPFVLLRRKVCSLESSDETWTRIHRQ